MPLTKSPGKPPILAQITPDPRPFPRRKTALWAIGGGLFFAMMAAAATIDPQPIELHPPRTVVQALPVPAPVVLVAEEETGLLPYVRQELIRSGDSLPRLFERLQIDDPDALAHIQGDARGREALRQLRAGQRITATVGDDGRVHTLSVPLAAGAGRLSVSKNDEGHFFLSVSADASDTLIEIKAAQIDSSLFAASDRAGIPDRVAASLADLFGTEINFQRDLRRGDRFAVIYESLFDQGVAVGTGRVLAAEFVNKGKRYRVALFSNEQGKEEYYLEDGKSLKEALLLAPLEFSRVSSSFGRRLHPIHKSWRLHAGVDYAAPTGTAVKAASDGIVSFVGVQGGYGNIVILDHRNTYSTAYAHLNGFVSGLRKGQRVSQGQVIGYVGMTGWATGPHLHYEVRINNVPHDPLKVALPEVPPLQKAELARFKTVSGDYFARLDLVSAPIMARLEEETEADKP
jgi:murein DD-endopeptidase MepM/ murein hydrolase activator NlpD